MEARTFFYLKKNQMINKTAPKPIHIKASNFSLFFLSSIPRVKYLVTTSINTANTINISQPISYHPFQIRLNISYL